MERKNFPLPFRFFLADLRIKLTGDKLREGKNPSVFIRARNPSNEIKTQRND